MAAPVYENNVVKYTETSLKEFGLPVNAIGARLVAGSGATGTAKIYDGGDNTGTNVASFSAVQATSDEMAICFRCDSGTMYVELTGSGAELFVYLK